MASDLFDELLMAIAHSETNTVQRLLQRGVDVNESDNGQVALHWAVENNQMEIVQMLVNSGAVVDARDQTGSTPLIKAAHHGLNDIAQFLLDNGASTDAMDPCGHNAAFWAQYRGHFEIIHMIEKTVQQRADAQTAQKKAQKEKSGRDLTKQRLEFLRKNKPQKKLKF